MKVLMKKTNKVEEVKDSYALNYLVPNGLAEIVSGNLEKKLAEKEKERESYREEVKLKQKKVVDEIDGKTFILKQKTNSKGELYASIGEKEIKKLVKLKKGVKVSLKNPIKEVGIYDVVVKIGGDKVTIKLEILEE